MFDLDEFKLRLSDLKSLNNMNNRLYSNTILLNDEIVKLSMNKNSFLYTDDDSVCIFIKEKDFFRMNYYIKDPNDCNCIKKALNAQNFKVPVVIDVVGKEQKIREHVNAMENIGCKTHAIYHRWQRRSDETEEYPYNYVSMINLFHGIEAGYVNSSEIDEAVRIINASFEPFISHVPDRNHLMKAVANHELFSIHQDGMLVGIFCIEVLGDKMVFLHNLVVDKEIDGGALGALLFTYALETFAKETTFSCWVDDTNHKSLRIVKKFNFIRDENMVSYILTY